MLVRPGWYLLLITFLLFNAVAWAQPMAGFNVISPTSNCNPAVFSFVNSSTGSGLTYEWNFGVYPGINSVFPDPSTTYLQCGNFVVKLVVTDMNGQKDSAFQMVNVRCSPTANFEISSDTGCIPYFAEFINTSSSGSGNITNYTWDFGDGNSGAGINPSHAYDVPGCKNVTLVVMNSYGCIHDTTINSFLCLYPPPVADFTSSSQTSCAIPFDVNYQADPGSGYSYQWTFQGGIPATSSVANPVVTYNSTDSFSASLITTNAYGCSDTIVKNNYVVITEESADFTMGTSPRCAPGNINVNGLATGHPVSWRWTVSQPASVVKANKKNTTISFPDAGNYEICITATYAGGCAVQKCSTVVVKGSPIAKFGADGILNTCLFPNVVTFTDSSSGTDLDYSWSFPKGIPASSSSATPPPVSYDTCGKYSASLTVTDSAGCRSTATKTNFLEIACYESSYTVTPGNGCLPLTAQFSGTSDDSIVSWLWNFDDSLSGAKNISTLQNPSHTFYTEGCYNVSLTTTNTEGCIATFSLDAAVCAGWRPHANFSANPPLNCASEPIQFIDSSTGTYSYTKYAWGFHDSSDVIQASYFQNPNHTFWDAGIWDIVLIVANYGCADTITKDDYVRTLDPLSSPRVKKHCGDPFTVTLDGTESPGATSYSWIILGGTPTNASTATVEATFPGPGYYNASLYVVNDTTGCSDLQNVVVHITGAGTDFTATPRAGCKPLQSCMSLSSNAVYYEWLVTDSTGAKDTTAATNNPCFTFEKAGIYNVQLIITDTLGCTDTIFKPSFITVTDPVASFTAGPLEGCAPLVVNFSNTSTSSGASLSGWNWNFGDPSSGAANTNTDQYPKHIFQKSGNYPVQLSIIDSNGCENDVVLYIEVNKPAAEFTSMITPTCEGTEACFTLNTVNNAVSYKWNFGDGKSADSANICHLYVDTGQFNASLVALDTLGCRDTVSAVVSHYYLIPDARFVADSTKTSCPPLSVSFSNLSTGVDSFTSWQWDFGDGQVSSLRDPFHIYTTAGSYTVKLITTNYNGCSDTLIYPDYIKISGPTAYVATAPTSGCVPHQTCMSAISSSAIKYTWNLGDGMVKVGGDSICYTYTRTGSFYPELILSDGSNCIFSLPMGRVDVEGTVAKFKVDTAVFCQQGTVHFTDSSYGTSPVSGWIWNFGDTASGILNHSTTQHTAHFYAAPGVYQVTQKIISANGCTDSTLEFITLHESPLPSVSIGDTTPCESDSVTFMDYGNSNSLNSHWWNFGDPSSGAANTSNLELSAHRYSGAGAYNITFTVMDTNGCSAADSLLLTVYPKPKAEFEVNDTCLNTQPIAFRNNSQGAISYRWNLSDGNYSSEPVPSHIYQDTGVYRPQLIAYSDHCSDTTSLSFKIYPIPVAAFDLPVNAACESTAEFPLQNISSKAVRYRWDFGGNAFSSLENPVAIYDSAGQYSILLTAIDENNCADTVSKQVTVYPLPEIKGIDINPAEGCPPLEVSLELDANDSDSYIWDFGADSILSSSSSPSASFIYNEVGSYSISVYLNTIYNCKDTFIFPESVIVHGLPTADFEVIANTNVYPYDGNISFVNHSRKADHFVWEFGDGNTSTEENPSYQYYEVDHYYAMLTAINEFGCEDTAGKMLHAIKKALYVPNALEPGHAGDDLVKVWKPIGIGLLSYRAQVYDQWGKLLWESKSLVETQPSEAWDGTYQGKLCPQDVYVWKIDAVFLDGTTWPGMSYSPDQGGGTKNIGSITLVR